MKELLIICGATASGKTALSVDCAERLNSEVISADSQLVYRNLNIGTAKPTKDEMRGVPHNLIDILNPSENFSVSDYEQLAEREIKRIKGEGKIPVVCGGTGFYINSILFDMGYGHTRADENIRKYYEKLLEEQGKERLFEILRQKDEKTAEKLHMNDTKRIIRALEIFDATGKKKSEQNDKLVPKYNYLAVACDFPREELYARIDKRVDKMFAEGLVEEVKNLIFQGFENCQCMQAIGYKEVVECLKNGDNESTMRDIIKQNTRRYAKRQITFFKKLPDLVWLKPESFSADKVLELLND